jgi:hypothetical protein
VFRRESPPRSPRMIRQDWFKDSGRAVGLGSSLGGSTLAPGSRCPWFDSQHARLSSGQIVYRLPSMTRGIRPVVQSPGLDSGLAIGSQKRRKDDDQVTYGVNYDDQGYSIYQESL